MVREVPRNSCMSEGCQAKTAQFSGRTSCNAHSSLASTLVPIDAVLNESLGWTWILKTSLPGLKDVDLESFARITLSLSTIARRTDMYIMLEFGNEILRS